MIIHHLKCIFDVLHLTQQKRNFNLLLAAILCSIWSSTAFAAFTVFNGGVTAESNWQTAAGSTTLENFEGYAAGERLTGLTSLGLGFDTLAGGGTPAIYTHHECCVTPYGRKHLGNFPNGINAINRWDDISMFILPGYDVTALGFWNGDGQRDTFVASIYDVSDNLLGTIGAFKGTFAGFVSDVAVARIVFDGRTGDGWNHLDGLQTNVKPSTSVPESETLGLLLLGFLGLLVRKRKLEI